MNDLLAFAIKAHGGPDRWNQFDSVSAHQNTGGIFLQTKGSADILDSIQFTVKLHKQQTSHFPFALQGQYTLFEPNRIAIKRADNTIVEELIEPRQSFESLNSESAWTNIQLAYFAGYAIWTYLTAPFSFAMPGFETIEIEPWKEKGETWRRLQVIFPENIDSHSREQVLYFDKEGLIRRHDYQVFGNAKAAHYVSGHQLFQGIIVPTRRRVYVRQDDNTPLLPGPLLVSIDLSRIQFR